MSETHFFELITKLKGLKQEHYECEDEWYSCPLSESGCADDRQTKCTCGAEDHNAAVDDLISWIRMVSE